MRCEYVISKSIDIFCNKSREQGGCGKHNLCVFCSFFLFLTTLFYFCGIRGPPFSSMLVVLNWSRKKGVFFTSLFTLDDLTPERRHYIDRYIKKSINNRMRDYYRRHLRSYKYGISFVSLDQEDPNLYYYEPAFDIASGYFEEYGYRIPIYNPYLFYALGHLTRKERTILLCNVVLSIPLKQIAHKLGISLRVVKRHKQRAIQKLKKEVGNLL